MAVSLCEEVEGSPCCKKVTSHASCEIYLLVQHNLWSIFLNKTTNTVNLALVGALYVVLQVIIARDFK